MSEILASPITSLDTFRDLLTAYRLPRVILSALELDLFTALGKRARMVAPLAAELKVSERGLEILCRNLAMCGLLTKKGPRYRNSPFAATALNARDRAYRGAYLELLKSQWHDWSRLTEAVRTGSPSITTSRRCLGIAGSSPGRCIIGLSMWRLPLQKSEPWKSRAIVGFGRRSGNICARISCRASCASSNRV
ncbi:MAG: methyltransferase dimerization domain-containing protein [Nitrospiraceae bacterium]